MNRSLPQLRTRISFWVCAATGTGVGRVCAIWALLCLLLVMGCSKQNKATPTQPPAPVSVATAVQRNVPLNLEAIGHVVPYQTVLVQSQVDGELRTVHFKEGDYVKTGELIFTIDPRPYEAALAQARSNVQKDQALAANAAVVESRNAELLTNNILSRDVYDQSRAQAEATRAAVAADQAAVKSAELQLSFCYIHAPIEGRLGTLLVNRGNIVKKQDTSLVTINRLRPIYVDFSVPEKHLPAIREHMSTGPLTVQAEIPGHEQHQPTGTLAAINNTVDRSTGTILLRALFPNEDEALWPGQYVTTALTLTTRSNAVVVPLQAVQIGQQGQYVFVVKPDLTVEERPVTPGPIVDGNRVIEKGLRPHERVVISGQIRLAQGTRVRIQNQTEIAQGKP